MMLRNMLEKGIEDQIIGGASKRSYWMLFLETGSYVVGLEVVAVFLPLPATCWDPDVCHRTSRPNDAELDSRVVNCVLFRKF